MFRFELDHLDTVDVLKLGGYALAVGAWALASLGHKRDAAGLAKLGHAFAVTAGALDLLEAPKHCGQRAAYDPRLASYVCRQCGAPVAFQPQLGVSA